MSELPNRPRSIWLRSFYGFGPEEDGYVGWTKEGPRDRMIRLIEDGDLFMIYGAASAETAQTHRNRVIGFLQVKARAIRDFEKASPTGMQTKLAKGWGEKWTHAIPVIRAWRVEEPILLERIAPKTYRSEAGQAIAVWTPPLLPEEIDLAMKIRVTEVNVFGEPALSAPSILNLPFAQAFKPSRAFPGSFGVRTATYEIGPTRLYLARFEGDGHALLGIVKPIADRSIVMKIGVSNEITRRLTELNSGFPPAAIGSWSMKLVSEPYSGKAQAEAAEQIFKDSAAKQLQSLGGEFSEALGALPN
jgi:hypothetical protein